MLFSDATGINAVTGKLRSARNLQHFRSHQTGGAYYCYFHFLVLYFV